MLYSVIILNNFDAIYVQLLTILTEGMNRKHKHTGFLLFIHISLESRSSESKKRVYLWLFKGRMDGYD